MPGLKDFKLGLKFPNLFVPVSKPNAQIDNPVLVVQPTHGHQSLADDLHNLHVDILTLPHFPVFDVPNRDMSRWKQRDRGV